MSGSVDVVVVSAEGNVTPRTLEVSRAYNLGSATRDAAEAVHHQEEVARSGVRIAFDIPAPRIYPLAPWAITTAERVGVQGPRTSGEVEIVIIVQEDDLLIGVGSDHTDRDLERTSIVWSKQACPNVIAPEVWRWAEIRDHWDRCTLWSDLDGSPYQRCGVDVFLDPEELVSIVRDRADMPRSGAVIFSGTYVSVTGELAFGRHWSFGIEDPVLGRRIEHSYELDLLLDEVEAPFRVPLHVGEA